MNLHTPICDLFEIELPIFLAGMGSKTLDAQELSKLTGALHKTTNEGKRAAAG